MAEHTTSALASVFAGARKIVLAKTRWRTRSRTEPRTGAHEVEPPIVPEISPESDLSSSESRAALALEFQAHAAAVRSQLIQYATLLADGDPELQQILEQVALEQPWPSS